MYSLALLVAICNILVQYLEVKVFGSFPLTEKDPDNQKLQNYLTTIYVVLVIPYAFPLLCQILIKLILFPFDIYFYNGKCIFNLVEATNTI
jgi:hypothetical protein